ncbi:MAG: hypothetical protein RL222_1032 [Bacteroidota bacterium]
MHETHLKICKYGLKKVNYRNRFNVTGKPYFCIMKLHFYKYQGTGNDFVLIDNRNGIFGPHDVAFISFLCDRRMGIGADGLMLLENAEGYDFKMVYFNADGRESTMCGNGGRCISAFAHHLGIVQQRGHFIAIDGEHPFEINGDIVKLKMIDVERILPEGNDFTLFTGSPHYVGFRRDIAAMPLVEEARRIRYNDTFREKGINVNFVEYKDGQCSMRTYERGVEDETLSCGTGTVAVALCVAQQQGMDSGSVGIQTPGGKLSVHFVREGNAFQDIWLEGPALKVFEGQIER